MNTHSSRSEHGQHGVPRIIKKAVLNQKSLINQVTNHVDETALSSNSSLYYKSPLHCSFESLCHHPSLVLIDWRSAAGLVATIAKTQIANCTIPSVHITPHVKREQDECHVELHRCCPQSGLIRQRLCVHIFPIERKTTNICMKHLVTGKC